jgi:GMP synthase - Glutamine amidotransferase domain
LPSTDSWDWLVILGGPMSVHDEDAYSWLSEEKQYIARAIHEGKTMIGICLGSQLIAECLGADVYPNKQKEIGWFKLQWLLDNEHPDTVLSSFPDEMTVFHWHGETYDLPNGARRLASSQACFNQAFIYGDHVYGFQFHLEMTEENIRKIVENCGSELAAGPYIQTADKLLNSHEEREQALHQLECFLDELVLRHGLAGQD